MSISLPTTFTKTAHKENWLVQLNHSGGSFTGLAFYDTTVGTAVWEDNTTNWEDEHDVWEDVETPAYTSSSFYHGCITSTSGIRDSLNLPQQKAQTGNVSFTCANLKIGGTDLSELLIGGSNNYINRSVKIYFQPDDATSLGACVQIYQGRLIRVSHDDATVNLEITAQRPWDGITIPQDRSVRGSYHPVVYGTYSINSSSHSSTNYVEDATNFKKHLFPVTVDFTNFNYHCLAHKTLDNSTSGQEATLHYYEKDVDTFLPLEDVSASASTTYVSTTGHDIFTKYDLKRHFKFKPVATLGTHAFTNPTYMVDDTDADDSSSGTNTKATKDMDTGSSTAYSVNKRNDTTFNMPAFSDMPDKTSTSTNHGFTVEVRHQATGYYNTTNQAAGIHSGYYALYDQSFTGSDSPSSPTTSDGAEIGKISNPATSTTSLAETTSSLNSATAYASDGYPDGFILRWRRYIQGNANGGTPTLQGYGTLNIWDIRFKCTLKIDKTNTTIDWNNRISSVKELYCGADGLNKSYSGGSGDVATGLEAHRDLLKRFTGFDAADDDIYNWSDAETARVTDAWNIRWWANKPEKLINILDQIQREFCFIGKFRHDGSYGYWHVKDSYSSGDVSTTLDKNDITGLKISNSSFDDLLTSIVVNYEKHPAENRYISTTSEDNSSKRTTYNIQTEENIKEVNLDMLVNNVTGDLNDDVNDGFIPYYGNMLLDVKTIVNCTIVNNTKGYLLETGDIIKFDPSSMDVKAFSNNWTKYFMVTKINRTLGRVSIECREVG